MSNRIEKDVLGEMQIDDTAYWGINTQRAISNFAISGYKMPSILIKSMAMVKKACLQSNYELKFFNDQIFNAISTSCDEIIEGKLSDQFPVDALQGGSGTSLNMNLNEVIANRALELLGFIKGDYSQISPIETVNLHQSTNDVFPTALKISTIFGFRELSEAISDFQNVLQNKEKYFADILILGRTEMQDAIPMTLGAQFASFSEAISRDRWRTFKCEERLRIVNIGGTAIGTGLTAPRKYIFLVIEKLRQITGLGLARADQIMDQTANTDVFTEVSGMLNANAANIIKISNDLRFLHYQKEIELPSVQTGSSIMPGKINPVILEGAISSSLKVLSNGDLINQCVSRGSNQINEFLPLIAFALLESIHMLININRILADHCSGITANKEIARKHFNSNEIIITAFLPHIGYKRAEELIQKFHSVSESDFYSFLINELGTEIVEETLSPESLMMLGYKQKD